MTHCDRFAAFLALTLASLGCAASTSASRNEAVPAALSALPSFAAKPGPLTIEEVIELPTVTEPSLSPDGTSVAVLVNEPTLKPKAKTRTSLWIVDANGKGAPRVVAGAPAGLSSLRWSPDGKSILGISAGQAWLVPAAGGAARQVTTAPNGASDPAWSPDGKAIAFATDVDWHPAAEDAMPAKVIDELLFRHWTEWRENKRTHTFVQPIGGGDARDLTPGDVDAPGFSLGGPTPYAFSRDGKTLFFTRGAEKDEATSTDFNLYKAAVDGRSIPERLTTSPGWDGSPAPSPDGKWLAYRAQKTPGFESDRFTLQILDLETEAVHAAAGDVDRWVDEIAWAPDGKSVFIVTEDEGTHAVWRAPIDGGASTRVYRGNFTGISVSPDAKFLVGRYVTATRSGEAARVDVATGALTRITDVNAAFFAAKKLGEATSVWIDGAPGVPAAKDGKIQGWLVKPPDWRAGQRYPFLLLVHGGPQQAWLDAFSGSMWTPQIFAAHGYVVLALNPHGSTGFGQELTNQISGDYGGAVFADCMNACDWAVAQGLADPERMGALGGSFGGYMVNWFLGHTDRFKALVSHAGLFNLESMYGVTEELWFPEWDLKGRPWDSDQYSAKSPHKFVKNFKTPMLVTHGELDYRVPIGEGIQLFTTLQRIGVPSRFVYFPDEGHWLLKARNREIWLRETLAWFDRYLKPRS